MCAFYKKMNSFFLILSRFTIITTVLMFIAGIVYVLYLSLFEAKIAALIDFNDIAMFLSYTMIPFISSISILKKFDPNIYLKDLKWLKKEESNILL